MVARCNLGLVKLSAPVRMIMSASPCRWFDLVIVLQTDNSLLFERLSKRQARFLVCFGRFLLGLSCPLISKVSLIINMAAAAAFRSYSDEKIAENMECEIMHIIVEEALESYRYSRPFSRVLA